jgi:CDP-glycerol glycerophosphotransferase
VGTTSTAEPEWRRWFAFNRYAPIGYPRNDVLHREPDEGDLANVDKDAYARAVEARRQGKQVFVYAPTFRDADRKWVLSAGLDAIARAVAKAGNLLIVNLHPVEQPQIPEMAKLLPGVTFVAPRTDAYPLLRQASALITDYSSVMFDFLQLDRPILLFRPDHEAYTQKSRKLFDDKLSVLPGPVVTHATQLINRLGDPALGQKPAHAQARQLLLKQLFDHQDGASGERLLGLIGDELDRLPRLACAA